MPKVDRRETQVAYNRITGSINYAKDGALNYSLFGSEWTSAVYPGESNTLTTGSVPFVHNSYYWVIYHHNSENNIHVTYPSGGTWLDVALGAGAAFTGDPVGVDPSTNSDRIYFKDSGVLKYYQFNGSTWPQQNTGISVATDVTQFGTDTYYNYVNDVSTVDHTYHTIYPVSGGWSDVSLGTLWDNDGSRDFIDWRYKGGHERVDRDGRRFIWRVWWGF